MTPVSEISAVVRSKFSTKFPGSNGQLNQACLKHKYNTMYPLVRIYSFKDCVAYQRADWHVGLQSLTAELTIYPHDLAIHSLPYDGRLDDVSSLENYDMILRRSTLEQAQNFDKSIKLNYSDTLGWSLHGRIAGSPYHVDSEGEIWCSDHLFDTLPKV